VKARGGHISVWLYSGRQGRSCKRIGKMRKPQPSQARQYMSPGPPLCPRLSPPRAAGSQSWLLRLSRPESTAAHNRCHLTCANQCADPFIQADDQPQRASRMRALPIRERRQRCRSQHWALACDLSSGRARTINAIPWITRCQCVAQRGPARPHLCEWSQTWLAACVSDG
jgi:hypothetical protein